MGVSGPGSCPRGQFCGRRRLRQPLGGASVDVQPALPFPLLADSLPGRPQLSLGLEVVVGCTCSSACPRSSANLAPSWPGEDITPIEGDVWPPQGHSEMPGWPPPPWRLAQCGPLCGGLGVLLGLCPGTLPREECSRMMKRQGASGTGQSKPLLLQKAKRRCQWGRQLGLKSVHQPERGGTQLPVSGWATCVTWPPSG